MLKINPLAIKEFMRVQKLSQEKLGGMLGVERTTVNRWLQHPETIQVGKLFQMIELLKCTLPDIVYYNEKA